MFNESNFIVRASGRREKSYYIDYLGVYKVTEISKDTGIEAPALTEKYLSNGADYDKELDIFYFDSIDSAKKTISDILKGIKIEKRGKIVFLTDAEIEYIRQALINEGVNVLHLKNKVKDTILKKLNV